MVASSSESRPEFDAPTCKQILEGHQPLTEQELSLSDAAGNQLGHEGAAEPSKPCTACPKRETCKEPCDRVMAEVPGVLEGRGHRENLTGLHPDTLQGIEKVRLTDVFAHFEKWMVELSRRQREVVVLYYREQMTEEEIASKLGISRSAVNGRLVRARKRKAEFEKALREEFYEHLKKERKDNLE